MKRFRFRFKSFATRLSVVTVIFTIIIFTVISIIFYSYTSDTILKIAIANTHSQLRTMVVQIDDKLNNTEIAIHNTAWMINKNNDIDSLFSIISHLVKDNDEIIGSAIAFEPGYGPNKEKPLMLYADYHNGNVVTRIMNNDYNYPIMDWYQIPKLLKKDYWSEPYYDHGGGNIAMSTFSHPLFNDKGEIFAIFTADISLDEFTALVNGLEPYKSSYSFLLSRNGYYLTHYDTKRIMNETVFSYALGSNNTAYMKIGHDMLAGKTGTLNFDNDGEDSYAFYCPIPDIGWSLCNVIPTSVILEDLNTTTTIASIAFLFGLILLFISTFQIIKRLSKPLEMFSQSAKEIAKGKFDQTLPVIKSCDEMRDLHDSFEYMQNSLSKYIEELRATTTAQERINSELHIASTIQMAMIPKQLPIYKNVELSAILHPAREVGGDLYNYFIEDNKLFFMIGDVAGKGIPAALIMAMISTLFNSSAPNKKNPADLVKIFNETISKSNDLNMFVTMIVGILNLDSGEMHLCNAGHNPLIIVQKDLPARFLDFEQNLPIGIINNFDYKENIFTLEPNTKLILYTDGITEAENISHLLYGEKRLVDIIESSKHLGVNDITEIILNDVQKHVDNAPQSDDITLLAIEYKRNELEPMKKEITLANDIKEITKIETFVNDIGEELNLSPAIIININLALEEAISNVINYAYPSLEDAVIHLYCSYTDNELVFLLTDTGIPFDPTEAIEPDLSIPIEERAIGGLGILLIRKIMNEVTYQRINNMNQLTLKKKI